jgi:hypothetical protein
MNRWYISLALGILLILTGGCDGQKSADQVDKAAIDRLQKELDSVRSENDEMLKYIVDVTSTVNETQTSLEAITKEAGILKRRADAERRGHSLNENQRESILGDVRALGEKIRSNERTIARLKEQMKQSRVRIAALEELVSNIQVQIEASKDTIRSYEDRIQVLTRNLAVAVGERDSAIGMVIDQDQKLHTGYFVMGTYEMLSEEKIVRKKGWLMSAIELDPGMQTSSFTQIDTRSFEPVKITLDGRDAKIVPSRGDGSYRLVEIDKNTSRLEILNRETFWEVSKYLAIVLD